MARTYREYCSACHGQDMSGGLGPSLIDDEWKWGSGDEDIARSIRNGFPELGMVPFKDVLGEDEIRALVIYIRERKYRAEREDNDPVSTPYNGVYQTEDYSFRLEKVASAPGIIWSFVFLPDGDILATERDDGNLYRFSQGKLYSISGMPDVWQRGTSGLLDITLHPDYAENGWVYICYSRKQESEGGWFSWSDWGATYGTTTVIRGKIVDDKWTEQQTIFETKIDPEKGGMMHFGSRMRFHDGYLFLAYGDHGFIHGAQDLDNPFGKIHRLRDDGSIPEDNPFVDLEGAQASIWSYGHRNPQGLVFDEETGQLWESEHGPRGGDEVNRIEKGKNYGWPAITYGMEYDGTAVSEFTHMDGMEQPVTYWTPSIAVCGIDFYRGKDFPEWSGNLILGALGSQELHRLVLDEGKVVKDELILKGEGRIRNVVSGPNQHLYVSLTARDRSSSGIFRLVRIK